jgi:putative Mg2+ transporter-C (MgtC) family protein
MPDEWQLVLRLLLAAGLAGALGIEREVHEQPAGFRTHTLVGLGAALFAIISAFGFEAIAGAGPGGQIRADVTRVASQIVVGIGFLGGGAIIKYGATVRGLTTAASLWVTAAVGTAVGIGMPFLATATTLIALIALVALRPLRGVLRRIAGVHVELLIQTDEHGHLGTVRTALRNRGVDIKGVEVTGQDGGGRSYAILAIVPKGIDPSDVAASLEDDQHILHVDWNR